MFAKRVSYQRTKSDPTMSTPHEDCRHRTRQLISQVGISEAEYAILNHIHFGCTRPKKLLPRFTAGSDYSLGTELNIDDATKAVRLCIQKGFLRVITDPDLDQIKSKLKRDQAQGPIYGFPNVGSVDFTDAGAEIWRNIEESFSKDDLPSSLQRGFAYCDVAEIRTRRYFATRCAAERERKQQTKAADAASTTKVIRSPSLQMMWWLPPAEGWQFDSTEKLRWTGRNGGSSPFLSWDAQRAGIDLARVRRACQHQSRDLSDWSVLFIIATWPNVTPQNLGRSATAFAMQQFGLRRARERIKEAVRRCLDQKLIGSLDHVTLGQNEAHAAIDPSSIIKPEFSKDGLNLFQAGIELMQEQGPLIFGESWLNGWMIEQEVFRCEHRYARNLLDIASVIEEYSNSEEKLLSEGPITPLRRWCVYWWKDFPTGYRVELNFGSN